MARTLFDLHRTVTIVEINDGNGEPIRVGIKAPTHATQTRLLTILNEAKVAGGDRGGHQWAPGEFPDQRPDLAQGELDRADLVDRAGIGAARGRSRAEQRHRASGDADRGAEAGGRGSGGGETSVKSGVGRS